MNKNQILTSLLLAWFEENKRAMPWRGETNPYKIWVSEIILQQTRVNQGWDYYLRFIETFPDVKTLANAPLESVLRVWQGLGYYSRARNMHCAAKQIMNHHNETFPNTFLELKKLKGIGDYTAAAISSIAYQLPHPAVDGNVLRVISRLFGVYENVANQKTVKAITEICQTLIPSSNPGDFNQALMEFGALTCIPKNPKCEDCALSQHCIALKQNTANQLPIKISNTLIKHRYFHYLIFNNYDKLLIEQRFAKDIWRDLFQFPLIETKQKQQKLTKKQLLVANYGNIKPKFLTDVLHKLTHQHLHIRFYYVQNELPTLKENQLWAFTNELQNFPFPTPILNFYTNNLFTCST